MIQFLGTNLHCKCFHFNDDDFYIFICRVLFYTFQQTVMFLLCSLFEIVKKSWHMHIPKKLLNRCWSCNTLIHMRKHCTLFLMLPPGHVSYLMKTKALKRKKLSESIGGSVWCFSCRSVDTNGCKNMFSYFSGEMWHSTDGVQCKTNVRRQTQTIGEHREEGTKGGNIKTFAVKL